MTDNRVDEQKMDALLQARLRQGLTQANLAEYMGVAPKTVTRWEAGTSIPQPGLRAKLGALLQIDPEEIWPLHANRAVSSDPANQVDVQQVPDCQPALASPVIWNVPYARNPFFTGREEVLEQLYTRLHSTRAAALSQPQMMSGLGGIGKTQLALEYAHRFRRDYRAVFWARAESTEALNASYTQIAYLLQLPQRDAQEQEVIVQAVKTWLRETSGWLLILDNADDLVVVQPFLPTFCPGHLVLTTRAQSLGKLAQRLEVETLDLEVGALLLLRRAGIIASDSSLETALEADRAGALALADELGGLPLALDQAGAYIEMTQCSLADYQQYYRVRRTELLALRSGPTAGLGLWKDDHPEPVATTWSLSFAKMEQASPLAAELLRACAFLASDAIPEDLLEEVLKTPFPSARKERGWGSWFSRITMGWYQQPKSMLPATDGERMQGAVALLRAYSLLQRNTRERMVRVHRLVQAVVRDTLGEDVRDVWIQRVIWAVEQRFPAVSFETWRQCERYLPQALICNEWIVQCRVQSREAAFLLYRAGWYLHDRARYVEAEPLYLRALAMYEQQVGAEHPDTARSLNNLALLYADQGKYPKAEPLLLRALAIREQWLGAEHPDTARSLNNLAQVYRKQGKYAEAERFLLRALAIREQQLGAEDPDTAQSLNNLALLRRNQGKYAEAEQLLLRALAIREQWLGAEHPDTAQSLNNLALIYRKQGKYAEAERFLLRALAIREQRLGAEHHETASSLNNLALLYENQGRYTEAEPLYVRALAIYEQLLGVEHPDTAQGLNNLALLWRKLKRYAEAEQLLLRTLSIRERRLGAEHPDTAQSLNNLALLYEDQGKYAEAEQLLLRALAIRERQLGAEHPDTAQSLNNLALLYKNQGKYTKGEPLYVRALAISEHCLGQNYPGTQTIRANYTALLEAMKQVKEAKA